MQRVLIDAQRLHMVTLHADGTASLASRDTRLDTWSPPIALHPEQDDRAWYAVGTLSRLCRRARGASFPLDHIAYCEHHQHEHGPVIALGLCAYESTLRWAVATAIIDGQTQSVLNIESARGPVTTYLCEPYDHLGDAIAEGTRYTDEKGTTR